MVRASKGTLVQCDSNVKVLIMMIDDEDGGGYVVQDLGDGTLLVKDTRLAELKTKLQEIRAKTVREVSDEED